MVLPVLGPLRAVETPKPVVETKQVVDLDVGEGVEDWLGTAGAAKADGVAPAPLLPVLVRVEHDVAQSVWRHGVHLGPEVTSGGAEGTNRARTWEVRHDEGDDVGKAGVVIVAMVIRRAKRRALQ